MRREFTEESATNLANATEDEPGFVPDLGVPDDDHRVPGILEALPPPRVIGLVGQRRVMEG
jgi:hypothetical protein